MEATFALYLFKTLIQGDELQRSETGLVFIVFGLWNNPLHSNGEKGKKARNVRCLPIFFTSFTLRISPFSFPSHCHLSFSLNDLVGIARRTSIFSPIWITCTSRVLRYKFHLLNAKFIRFIRDLNHFSVRSTEKF